MSKRKKERGSTIAKLAVLCFAAYAAFTLINMQLKVTALEREIATVQQNVQRQKLKNAETERLLSLDASDEYIEQLARERLGFCYPDEKIIVDRSGS